MKWKVGDVLLVKMVVHEIIDDDVLARASHIAVIRLAPGDIFALVSRKPKKENTAEYTESAFMNDRNIPNIQPAKWTPTEGYTSEKVSKIDIGEPFYPDLLAQGWKFGSLPNDARMVQILLGDGVKCNGKYAMGCWIYSKDSSTTSAAPPNVDVIAWKEIDK